MKIFNLVFLLSLTLTTVSQNLVPNPEFEQYSDSFCGIMGTNDFSNTASHWLSPNTATPSLYFTNIDPTCYNYQPQSQYSGPIGIKGSQMPRSGDVMAGLWLYTIPDFNQRQYVHAELTTPMMIGETYVVEFYVSLADSMEFYIDKIGAHLSTSWIDSNTDEVLDYEPQIEADDFISDAENWTLISDTLTAEENFSHIMIGNFYNDTSTSTIANPLHSGALSTYGAYYFLDDVRIELVNDVSVDVNNPNNIQVYPTLVRDNLTLKIPRQSQPVQVEIYNSVGQMVRSFNTHDELTITDLSSLVKGVYVICLLGEKVKITRRFVKH